MDNSQKTKIVINQEDLMKFAGKIALADQRINRRRVHDADVLVFIAVAAILSGVETWTEMEFYAKIKDPLWLKLFPGYTKAPSHDTFNRFFSMLDPQVFEVHFRDWIRDIMQGVNYRGQIAIDGKTISKASETDEEKILRKNGEITIPKSKMHIISAYATELNLSLGQIKTDVKSNEITHVPMLLDTLDVKGCVISLDAMGCQTAIAKKIIEKDADYVLFVKDNQRALRKHIKYILDSDAKKPRKTRNSRHTTVDDNHGRIETRECFICNEKLCFGTHLNRWEGVKSMAVIHSTRYIKATGEKSEEYRYVISSLKANAKEILEYARNHWAIENNLHWQLDVSFNEDGGRRKNNAAQNFSMLSKMALTILKQEETKIGIKSKRKMAGWSTEYLLGLMNQF